MFAFCFTSGAGAVAEQIDAADVIALACGVFLNVFKDFMRGNIVDFVADIAYDMTVGFQIAVESVGTARHADLPYLFCRHKLRQVTVYRTQADIRQNFERALIDYIAAGMIHTIQHNLEYQLPLLRGANGCICHRKLL